MSDIPHKREFSSDPEVRAAREKELAKRQELAGAYARALMGTVDGRTVLADLRAKFGLGRLCFTKNEAGRFDYLAAAVTDGERHVMSEVESMLRLARPEATKDLNQ